MNLLEFDEDEKEEMKTIDYKLVDAIVKLTVVVGLVTYFGLQNKENFEFKQKYTPKTQEYFDSIRHRQDSIINSLERNYKW